MPLNENTLQRRSEAIEEPSSDATMIDRVKYLIARMKKTQQQFAQAIGVDGPNLSRMLHGKTNFSDAMVNRIVVNLGISKEWLLHGTDVPFPKNPVRNLEHFELEPETRITAKRDGGVPVYDIDVSAGYEELSRMFTDDRVIGFVQLPQVSPTNILVRVSGESMLPQITDGAYLSIRPINNDAPIFWGQTYLVVLDDYRMVKVLRKHQDPKKVILHSNNPNFDDVEIKKSDIRKLYVVDSVINWCKLS